MTQNALCAIIYPSDLFNKGDRLHVRHLDSLSVFADDCAGLVGDLAAAYGGFKERIGKAGILRKKKCAALGAGRGYRTELSMASQEAWDYAQQICSKRYMIAGILMAVAALLFIRVAPTDTLASLYVFTAVIALFEVVTVILLIASVETSLRKRFVPKAAA